LSRIFREGECSAAGPSNTRTFRSTALSIALDATVQRGWIALAETIECCEAPPLCDQKDFRLFAVN
jgi:hypothetical protein